MAATTTSGLQNSEKLCKYCKKKVAYAVDCEFCGSSFHPSCAIQSKAQTKGGKVNCCTPREKSEVKKNKSDENFDQMDEKKIRNILKELLDSALNPFKKKIEEDMGDLTKSVQYMSEVFEQQKKASEDLVREFKALRNENTILKQRIDSLENKLNIQEQREKQKNVLIVGIQKQKLDTKKVVQKLITAMKIELKSDEIVDSFRLKQKDDGPILVKFNTEDVKNKITRRIKELKGIKVKECGLEGENKNIYINEDLTYHNQQIFKKAREFRKQNKLASVFCRNGKIFLRKTFSDPPIQIRAEKDLKL